MVLDSKNWIFRCANIEINVVLEVDDGNIDLVAVVIIRVIRISNLDVVASFPFRKEPNKKKNNNDD